MAYENPTRAQIDAVSNAPAAKQGNVAINRNEDGYVFASGILDPEHSNYLSYQFPQYLGTAILERIGSYEVAEQDVFSWSEMDRTRRNMGVTGGGGVAGPSAVLTTDVDAVNGSDGYAIVGDNLQTESNKVLKVIAVAATGGFQTITVVRADGLPLTATDVVDGENLGHLTNAHIEYSDAPKGRIYLPEEKFNVIQTIRRSCYMTGKALTNRTYFKDGVSWCYEQEEIDSQEFAKDRENAVMFGELNATGDADDQTCEGINTSVLRGGVNGQFTGAVTEDDIQDQITALRITSPAKEYTVFCGTQYMADAHKALRDYHIGGGVDYGSFKDINMVGISLNAYRFMDITIYFVHYPTFDDTATLPYNGVPTATKINYSNYSLWLSMSTMSGKNGIDLMYKELKGLQRKFVLKVEDGMMGDGPKVASGKDGQTTHMLSDIAPRVRNLNHNGTHRANG